MGLLLRNPASAVYGTITVGALLAAESAHAETYAKSVAAVLITMVVYWLADSYAIYVGERLRSGGSIRVSRLLATMRHELAILAGATVPLATLVLCWLAGVSLSSALNAAVWACAAVIVATELVAGLRAHLTTRQLLAQSALGALLGLAIVVMRALLH